MGAATRARPVSCGQPLFDGLPDDCRRVGAIECVDGNDSGRGRHVYFRQPAPADDVDPDEQKPAPLELGTECRADFSLTFSQLGLGRASSDGEVRPNFVLGGDSVDRPRDLAVD